MKGRTRKAPCKSVANATTSNPCPSPNDTTTNALPASQVEVIPVGTFLSATSPTTGPDEESLGGGTTTTLSIIETNKAIKAMIAQDV